jgi:putative DNA primase/helicase
MLDDGKQLQFLNMEDMYFLTKIPVNYNPDATCPDNNVFFSRVLPNENNRNTIKEILGFCLYRKYIYHNWFIFYGNGNNGKSVTENLFKKFLGQDNVSAETVYAICTSKFSSSQLFGKMVNISVEMPLKGKNKGISLEEIKSLTGEDMKSAQKKFQTPFIFENYAKLITICNKVGLELQESDDIFALWHRLCPIEFPVTIPKSEQDPLLIDKLTTPEELSGLLNQAIEGFQRLKQAGKFSNEKDWELKRDEYIMISDPAKAFIDREIEEDENFDVATEDVYFAYKEFCETHGKPAIAKNAFTSKMNTYLKTYVSNANRNGKRFKIYVGIKLKNKPEKNLERDFKQQQFGDSQ